MNSNKIDLNANLPIMEQFYTIQGEGFHSGRAAYFIRIEGCDVGCIWCDVKESWEIGENSYQTVKEIVAGVKKAKAKFCVITGGEPCMHDLTQLTDLLIENNIEIAIETSGCYTLKGKINWYCFSPKKFKKPIPQAFELANELKIIVSHPSDFTWAEELATDVSATCKLYLQPEWSKSERFLPQIIEYVKNNPKWSVSLQTHKYMNIP